MINPENNDTEKDRKEQKQKMREKQKISKKQIIDYLQMCEDEWLVEQIGRMITLHLKGII